MPHLDSPRLVAAVDLGGTKIRSLVVDEQGVVRGVDHRFTEAEAGLPVVVDRIEASVRTALVTSGVRLSELVAVGVSAPGPVDFEHGVVLEAPNLPGWQEVPLAAMLRERLGRPTLLENDANAAAVGEHRFGAGRGVRDLIYLTVSTGIGGGLILNGQLYRGADGTAGELGHIVVDERGPLHTCGLRGCLEVMASGTAIARLAREAVEAGRSVELTAAAQRGELTSREVHAAADAGDRVAREILASAAHYLAIGFADFINIFNPRCFVVGGGAARIRDDLIEPAFAEARGMAFRRPAAAAELRFVALGENSGALGMAALALDALDRRQPAS